MTMLMIFRFNFLRDCCGFGKIRHNLSAERDRNVHAASETNDGARSHMQHKTAVPAFARRKNGYLYVFSDFYENNQKNIAFLRAICYNTKPDK